MDGLISSTILSLTIHHTIFELSQSQADAGGTNTRTAILEKVASIHLCRRLGILFADGLLWLKSNSSRWLNETPNLPNIEMKVTVKLKSGKVQEFKIKYFFDITTESMDDADLAINYELKKGAWLTAKFIEKDIQKVEIVCE